MIIAEHLHGLFVTGAVRYGVHLWIHVPVINEDVHPAVVVKIYKTAAPLNIAITWLADFRRPCHVRENATSEVPIEIVDLVGVVGH